VIITKIAWSGSTGASGPEGSFALVHSSAAVRLLAYIDFPHFPDALKIDLTQGRFALHIGRLVDRSLGLTEVRLIFSKKRENVGLPTR